MALVSGYLEGLISLGRGPTESCQCYDHIAGWLGDLVTASTPKSVRFSYSGEKHGKGQVDGLFGQMEGWIWNHAWQQDCHH